MHIHNTNKQKKHTHKIEKNKTVSHIFVFMEATIHH